MNVYSQIQEKLAAKKIHMTLLDPATQPPADSALLAEKCVEAGSDAIMIGGSTGVTAENLDETVLAIKDVVDVPTILFPSGASALSPNLDALYFMMVMNSNDPRFITGEQMLGAPYIKKMGIETISMGYIIVEPGMTVGKVSNANLVGREDLATALGYSLSAQMFGMKLVYIEAGSGAPNPPDPKMVRYVKQGIDIPLVVGGGIRSPESARNVAEAGADIIVTGTLVERLDNLQSVKKSIGDVVKAIREVSN